MNSNNPFASYRLTVYHPNGDHCDITPAIDYSWGGVARPVFAVYRPAHSARGNTRNPARRLRDTLTAAYRLATLPL